MSVRTWTQGVEMPLEPNRLAERLNKKNQARLRPQRRAGRGSKGGTEPPRRGNRGPLPQISAPRIRMTAARSLSKWMHLLGMPQLQKLAG
jgi:hypothetical protein